MAKAGGPLSPDRSHCKSYLITSVKTGKELHLFGKLKSGHTSYLNSIADTSAHTIKDVVISDSGTNIT